MSTLNDIVHYLIWIAAIWTVIGLMYAVGSEIVENEICGRGWSIESIESIIESTIEWPRLLIEDYRELLSGRDRPRGFHNGRHYFWIVTGAKMASRLSGK